jgi:hypothetical protein
MVYGIISLAVLYFSFFFSNVWVHLLVSVLIAGLFVTQGNIAKLVGRSG